MRLLSRNASEKTPAMIATMKDVSIMEKKNPIARNIVAIGRVMDSWNANIAHSLTDLLRT